MGLRNIKKYSLRGLSRLKYFFLISGFFEFFGIHRDVTAETLAVLCTAVRGWICRGSVKVVEG